MVTDSDLYQLTQRVKELEAQVEFLYQHFGITFQADATADDPRIVEQLRRGNIIEAIKIHRMQYNSDLVSAKKAIDEIKLRLRL